MQAQTPKKLNEKDFSVDAKMLMEISQSEGQIINRESDTDKANDIK